MNDQPTSRVRNVQTFEDLDVYKAAFEFQQRLFLTSRKFPRDEAFSLTDQIRRSSRSIGSNIAEAWAKRRYPAAFVNKLSDSDGELQETIHWLNSALAGEYLNAEVHQACREAARGIGAMLGKMIANHESWCQPPR